ncbi:hypothetical protein M422DRAFT_194423, partial [Sphaerobolus stellatus SS14]
LSTSLRFQLKDTNVHIIEISPSLTESELHDHGSFYQGSTPAHSKFWLSLDEFAKITMEGLLRGDGHTFGGNSEEIFSKFEKGNMELIQKTLSGMKVVIN